MKIRQGFVSNSSSSSFVLLGKAWDSSEEFLKDIGKTILDDDGNEVDDERTLYRSVELILNDTILTSKEGQDEERCYVGISPNNLKEDRTISQIKEDIAQALTQLGATSESTQIDWHSECWMDN